MVHCILQEKETELGERVDERRCQWPPVYLTRCAAAVGRADKHCRSMTMSCEDPHLRLIPHTYTSIVFDENGPALRFVQNDRMRPIPIDGITFGETLSTLLSFADLRLFSVAFPLADDAVGLGTGDAVDVFVLGRLWSRWCLGLPRDFNFLF